MTFVLTCTFIHAYQPMLWTVVLLRFISEIPVHIPMGCDVLLKIMPITAELTEPMLQAGGLQPFLYISWEYLYDV